MIYSRAEVLSFLSFHFAELFSYSSNYTTESTLLGVHWSLAELDKLYICLFGKSVLTVRHPIINSSLPYPGKVLVQPLVSSHRTSYPFCLVLSLVLFFFQNLFLRTAVA